MDLVLLSLCPCLEEETSFRHICWEVRLFTCVVNINANYGSTPIIIVNYGRDFNLVFVRCRIMY
jgi:hypothetical protein